MFNFLQNFLELIYFKVKDNVTLSDTKIQREGILQGNLFRPTFFTLKINKIVAPLPNDNRFQKSLYIDDLLISYWHSNWRIVKRMLQDSIAIVENFAQKNGYKFSHKQNIYVTIYHTVEPASIWTSTRQH